MGKVAYRLDLPPIARKLLVFHVSQLMAAIGNASAFVQFQTVEPEVVLGVRNVVHCRGNSY